MGKKIEVIALSEWVTANEAADLTGYTVRYIRQLARQGDIESRKIAAAWLIKRESLQAYTEEMDALGDQRHNPRRNPQWIESKRRKTNDNDS